MLRRWARGGDEAEAFDFAEAVAVKSQPPLATVPVPGKKRGYVTKDEQPMVMDENAMQHFMDMLMTLKQHRAEDAGAHTNFQGHHASRRCSRSLSQL